MKKPDYLTICLSVAVAEAWECLLCSGSEFLFFLPGKSKKSDVYVIKTQILQSSNEVDHRQGMGQLGFFSLH
jgi:hypothetical protein